MESLITKKYLNHKFLASLGGKDTYFDKMTVDANQILN